MILVLQRKERRCDGIFSVLSDSQGKEIAKTLEHAYPCDNGSVGGYIPKVSAGSYLCQRGFHRLHPDKPGFETFQVMGVKNHDGILFHKGNVQDDSKGCILVGRSVITGPTGQMIEASRIAFDAFLKLLVGFDSFQLSVLD